MRKESVEVVRRLSCLSALSADNELNSFPVSFIRMNPEEPKVALVGEYGVGKQMADTVMSFTEPSLDILLQIDALLNHD